MNALNGRFPPRPRNAARSRTIAADAVTATATNTARNAYRAKAVSRGALDVTSRSTPMRRAPITPSVENPCRKPKRRVLAWWSSVNSAPSAMCGTLKMVIAVM